MTVEADTPCVVLVDVSPDTTALVEVTDTTTVVVVDVDTSPATVVEVTPAVTVDVLVTPPPAAPDVLVDPDPTVTVVEVGYDGPPGPTGPQGPPGASAVITVVLGADTPAIRVMTVHPNGLAYAASSDDPTDPGRTVGVSRFGGLAGDTIVVTRVGIIDTPADLPIGMLYLGESGELTANPTSGVVSYAVARALTTRRVTVDLGVPVYNT